MEPIASRFFSLENASEHIIRPMMQSSPPRMLGWDVPPEELVHIPKFWLAFPEPEHTLHLGIALLYTILFFVAIFGNGMVIWIFVTSKSLRTASNIFVVNLAIADFGMMAKAPIVIYNSVFYGFALGQYWCQVFATVGSMTGIMQATTNLCIAYDRYKNISDPMGGRMSKKKAIIMVVMTWLYALPWTLMPLMGYWGRFVPEGYLTTCTFDYLDTSPENKMFVFFIFIFAYFFPMWAIIFFYAQIVGHVFSHEKALKAQAKKMNVESLRSGEQTGDSAEVRIAKTAIMICGLFVASWTPYAVIALIGTFGNQAILSPTVSMVPAICCKLVACFDPYVYAISHPKFRAELQKSCPGLCGCINEPEPVAKAAETATQNATS